MTRVAVLSLACLVVVARTAPAQRVEAGLVDSISGARDGLRVFRDGRWETLARLQPLYVGDSVAATGQGTRARARLHGRGAVWVCAESAGRPGCPSGLRIGAPARGGGLGIAVRGLIQSALAPLFSGESWTRTVSTVARGDDDIVVPLLGTAPEIRAGNRLLELAWLGGTPPFTVQLVKDGAGAVRGVTGVTGQSASLGRFAVIPGEYGIRINDSRGVSRQVRFRVVSVADLPRPPAEYEAPELSGGARTILNAAWLAGREGGRWAWEAYLRLGTLPDDALAVRMRAELAAGRLPPAL